MRLQAFDGDWEIERDIEDVRAGRTGALHRHARASRRRRTGLAYHEEGRLALGDGPAMTATRDYLWRDGGAGAIEVCFDDGRFFHRFLRRRARPGAEHDCPPDRYRVRYDFAAGHAGSAEWRVTGPRKDYAMVSRFHRAGP